MSVHRRMTYPVSLHGALLSSILQVCAAQRTSSPTLTLEAVTVGTPSQERTVIIGTASSDLYFDASSADECQLNNANSPTACRGGSFDPSQSKTYSIARAAPAFNITYGDGSTATGPYATDVVGIGNVAISGIEFGLAENFSVTSGNSVGILGLGYYTDEAVNSTSNLYPGLVDVMAYTGVIKSRLYSIYLGNGGASMRSTNAVSGILLTHERL